MSKKYSHTQYPSFKDINPEELSNDQILIRSNRKQFTYDKTIKCRSCGKELPITEFWLKDKKTGRRSTKCRDCSLRDQGVVEIGKTRFAMKVFEKNFRRCSVCKNLMPLTEFSHDKNRYGGYSNNCKTCNALGVSGLQKKGKSDITDWYVREYGKRKGVVVFDEVILNELRNEILEKRKPKYFIDGKEFVTIADFARYIESEYGLPVTMTEKRIADGKSLEECKLTENEMRSAAYTKGKIKVTDTVTGEVFEFKNTLDKGLRKMFSTATITQCLKSGRLAGARDIKTKKYPNPCKIERVDN